MGYINGCNIPHTLRRNDIFYVYFRLHDNQFFRCSIGTDSPRRCSLIISRLEPYISLFRLGKIGREQLLKIIRTMKKLTSQDIDLFVASMNAEILDYVEAIPSEARADRLSGELSPTPVELRETCSSFFQKHYESALFDGEESATENYFKRALSVEFDISGMEKEIALAATNHAVLLHQSQQALSAFLRKDLGAYSQTVSSIKQRIPVPTTAQIITPLSNGQEMMTLSEAWKEFVKFKSSWKLKVQQINGKYFEVIKSVLGADKPVAEITRRDIKNLLEVLEGLPRQNKKPYNRMTIQQCLDLDEVPEDDLISSKTVKDYLKLCQGLFSTFLTGELDVLESSPTNNVKYEAKSKGYGGYSHTEMRKLVAHFATLDGWKKWGFLLLAYTGARRSEIANLKVSDVRLDDDSQRYYIMIEDSKTEAGIRQVPISLHLINMGLLDYLKGKQRKDKLFPEISYSNQVTRIFHGIRDILGIDYLNDFNERRIVHSFRHTFITEVLSKNNALTLVQQTVGHEHSGHKQTQTYMGRMRVSDLLPVVDSIDWL